MSDGTDLEADLAAAEDFETVRVEPAESVTDAPRPVVACEITVYF
ncbi:hypothetical protein J2Y89_000265 [Curtobacterium herbarum]|jgi:hypothetical protein|nr:hypothetical protein [Curtobacterium herbarum]MCP1501521.1 hypothetical protein [Curtobacterium herbarum]